MFPEFRELISKLKTEDDHFSRLFNKHNELDQTIKNIESGVGGGNQFDVEVLKKEKLKLKDELYVILKKAEA
ncbi:MAG: DUF465 domain-containing protein [Aquitalea sp.]|nr:DUF465 domain-containing protein [Aquitalea sp.]